jgi:AcrR family transcriptional regulator
MQELVSEAMTSRGRPRDSALDEAIDAATESVLIEDGYPAVSIDRIARLAGTTRAAVYRRVRSPGDLVVRLIISRFGVDPAPDSGDLRTDLLQLQRLQREFFANPISRAALAGLLTDLRTDRVHAAEFYERFIAPRRRSVATMLDRATARGEIGPVERPELISDLLTGPLLLRTVMPAIGSIDEDIIEATVDAALSRCQVLDDTPR